MALEETFVVISAVGFLIAAGFSLKSYFITREATNAWMLLSLGFVMLAVKGFLTLLFYSNSGLGYFGDFARSIELVGVVLIFAAMAVYYKEKRVCEYCYRKKGDGKTLKDAKRFADGV